jgi:hypothetical protein
MKPQLNKKKAEFVGGKEIYGLVQCQGFRCLAVRKTDGNWYNYYLRQLLSEPVTLLQEFHHVRPVDLSSSQLSV